MDQDPDDSPDDVTSSPSLLEEGQYYLDRCLLDEAEDRFQRALGAEPLHPKTLVHALSGLAEASGRRVRLTSSSPKEWHYHVLRTLALQNDLSRTCKDLEAKHDRNDVLEKERRNWYWLKDVLKKSSKQVQAIKQLMFSSFQQNLVKADGSAELAYSSGLINSDWLKDFESFLEGKLATTEELVQVVDSTATDLEAVENNSDEDPKRPAIDYDRVQSAIKHLVRQVSFDMRQKFKRKKFSEEMFRSSVSNEMIAHFSVLEDTRDITSLFENAMVHYTQGGLPDSELDDYLDQTLNRKTPPPTSQNDVARDNGIVHPKHITFIDHTKFNLPGILTVWKAYNAKPTAPLPRASPYLLEGFEELSSLTEDITLTTDASPFRSAAPLTDNTREGNPPSGQHMTLPKLKHALVVLLTDWSETLGSSSTTLREACEVYKQALRILHATPLNETRRTDLTATILKNIGLLKCQLGNTALGSQLMQESIELLSAQNDNKFRVAEILYELGDVYMNCGNNCSYVSEHTMQLVKNEIDRKSRGFRDAETLTCDEDDGSDSDDDDCGETYDVSAHEAASCYKHALSILKENGTENHTGLYVDLLTRYADCSIVIGQHERATRCYEEALSLCQNTLGSQSITNSAHILSMLGTTNFLLGTYSKALAMYETATVIQRHLYGFEDNFEMAFTLTMHGITYFEMKKYHNCVGIFTKAVAIYSNINEVEGKKTSSLHRWFFTQSLFCLGFSQSLLNFPKKALQHFEMAIDIGEKVTEDMRDIRQQVMIFKSVADIYATLEMNSTSLDFYKKALELSVLLEDEHSVTTLQNKLLNTMAGVFVSKRQYGDAAEYLDQALGYQKDVETTIKSDLTGLALQLGITCRLSGDLDRAVDCYEEVLSSAKTDTDFTDEDVLNSLLSLGTLHHVKACLQDDNEKMLEHLSASDNYYREAVAMSSDSIASTMYGNFLYQQEQYADALEVITSTRTSAWIVHYYGPEQAVLPEHLLHDLTELEDVCLNSNIFSLFLEVLCLKKLCLFADATDRLVAMMAACASSDESIDNSMLGYAFLEMGLCMEAASCFGLAATSAVDNGIPCVSFWICVCLDAYGVLAKALVTLTMDVICTGELQILPLTHLDVLLDPETEQDRSVFLSCDESSKTLFSDENYDSDEWVTEEWTTEEGIVETPYFLENMDYGSPTSVNDIQGEGFTFDGEINSHSNQGHREMDVNGNGNENTPAFHRSGTHFTRDINLNCEPNNPDMLSKP